MISRVLCIAVVVFANLTTYAQEDGIRKGGVVVGLGMGFGYEQLFLDPAVRPNIVVNGLTDIFIGENTIVNVRAGYSSSGYKDDWMQVSVKDYDLKNISLCVSAFHRLTKIGALGLGAGVDWIRYGRHTIATGPGYYYDSMGNKIEIKRYVDDIGWDELSPSVSALAKSDIALRAGARVSMLFYYKFIFPGDKHGPSVFHSVNTMGFTLAFVRDLSL